MAIPFKLSVPDKVLSQASRLVKDASDQLTPFRHDLLDEDVEEDDFRYGLSPRLLNRLVNYFANEYDWRTQEKGINEMPQFTLKIIDPPHEDELTIHFVHAKSERANAVPLLSVSPIIEKK